nr:development/cell death domain-containing protein [Tanacetum cinerariifolium]
MEDLRTEANKLANLHHPNFVAFYGVLLNGRGGSVPTVTKFRVNGSLRIALQKNESGYLQSSSFLRILLSHPDDFTSRLASHATSSLDIGMLEDLMILPPNKYPIQLFKKLTSCRLLAKFSQEKLAHKYENLDGFSVKMTIIVAKKELQQLDDLVNGNSVLFKHANWKEGFLLATISAQQRGRQDAPYNPYDDHTSSLVERYLSHHVASTSAPSGSYRFDATRVVDDRQERLYTVNAIPNTLSDHNQNVGQRQNEHLNRSAHVSSRYAFTGPSVLYR